MDRNPRVFFLEVTEINVNVDADAEQDQVVLEFAGRVPPEMRKRLARAIESGPGGYILMEKRLL